MKPRLKQIIRWIKYPALIAGITVVTIALVAYGRGYFYSFETGEIASGGLLYINSEPSGANVRIDDSAQGTTETRIRLASGQYGVELQRDGYRSWTKEVRISEADVTYARYPVLVPNTVPSEPVRDLSNVRFISQSDDQQYLAVAETVDGGDRIRVFRVGASESSRIVFTPPSGQRRFTVQDIVWSPDVSRAFVHTATPDGATRYFTFNPDVTESGRAINSLAGTMVRNPVFGENDTFIYGMTDDDVLRRASVMDGSQQTVARNIAAFDVYEDHIYAVQQVSGGTRLVRIDDGNVASLLAYPTSYAYELKTIRHADALYIVLHNTDTNQVTLVTNIGSDVDTMSLPPGVAEHMTISPNGQYVVMRTGTYFTTYDLEREQTYRFTLPDVDAEPQWYTDHHMVTVSQDEVILFEFDGANSEYLTAARPFRVFGNHQRDDVYSIQRNQLTDQLQLQRTDLE